MTGTTGRGYAATAESGLTGSDAIAQAFQHVT